MSVVVYICRNVLYTFAGTFIESNLAVCSKDTSESGTVKNPVVLIFVSRHLIVMWDQLDRGAIFCQSLEYAADRRRGTCALYLKTETVVFFCECVMFVFCHGTDLTYSSDMHGVVEEQVSENFCSFLSEFVYSGCMWSSGQISEVKHSDI